MYGVELRELHLKVEAKSFKLQIVMWTALV